MTTFCARSESARRRLEEHRNGLTKLSSSCGSADEATEAKILSCSNFDGLDSTTQSHAIHASPASASSQLRSFSLFLLQNTFSSINYFCYILYLYQLTLIHQTEVLSGCIGDSLPKNSPRPATQRPPAAKRSAHERLKDSHITAVTWYAWSMLTQHLSSILWQTDMLKL